jgi:cell wall assembly regulator SMI1
MSDDIREQAVDELEVSVKTASFLQTLGVSTVGELLALPELRAHKLVLAELTAAFEEIGVEYEGKMNVARPAKKLVKATGDIVRRWRTIASWLEKNHPSAIAGFNDPASAELIAASEKALGRVLPEEYKQFLAIHDGQQADAPMVETASLLSIGEVAKSHKRLVDLCKEPSTLDEEMVAEGIRPIEFCAGWVPIGRSARGRDFLCIDLDPGPKGTSGQIIMYAVDDEGRSLVAKSFADLLSVYFEQVQAGEIEIDDDQ